MNTTAISLLLLTFNCGKSRQPVEALQRSVQYALKGNNSPAVTTAAGSNNDNNSNLPFPPQMLVFGFEEVTSIAEASFGMLENNLHPIQLGITEGLNQIYPNNEASYQLAARSQIGAIATLVYLLEDSSLPGAIPLQLVDKIVAGTRRGYVYSSLKGGAGVRVTVRPKNSNHASDNQQFTFVDAHLAANEGQISNRNKDFYGIITSLGFKDGFGAYKPNSHLFFMGDLNYRATAHLSKSLQQSSEPLLAENEEDSTIVDNEYYTKFKKTDELYHVLRTGQSFYGLTEAPITFPPTYKFKVGSTENVYNEKRAPSWCDRILYLPYNKPVKVHKYDYIPEITTSDHKPVFLRIDVPAEYPKQIFSVDPNDSYKLIVAPEHLPTGSSSADSSTPISLSLAENVGYYDSLGRVSDWLIGWALFLASTPQGRIYSVLLGAFVLFLYWF